MSRRTTEPDRTYNYVTMSQWDLIPLNQSCEVPTILGELDERVHGPGSSTKLQGMFQRFVFVFFGRFVTICHQILEVAFANRASTCLRSWRSLRM